MIKGITGVILAGGQSRRFGSNKALADLGGRPLIEHGTTILAPLFANRLLVTNTPETYAFLGWPITNDRFPGAGPLAGIHAALLASADDKIFVTACDMPLLHGGLIRLICETPGDWDVVLPCPESGPEPLCALYGKESLPTVEAALQRGENSIQDVLKTLRAYYLKSHELSRVVSDITPFANVNRQDDLRSLASGKKMK